MSGRGSERRKSSGSGSAVTEDGIEEAISVSVRVRPLNARELKSNTGEAWKVAQEESTISSGDDMLKYTFDNVFNTAATTANVYNKVARDLVSSVLQGMNGTVFAYGQTASGKTFTMQGEPQAPGMLGLAAQQVFEEIQSKPHYQFLLNVSYIEIYNEQVKDLLSDSDNNLRIREDRDKGFFVDGLTTKSVVSVEELLQAREEGERRRHVGETNMNARSSRSHTVFTLKIEMRDSRGMFDQDDEGEACTGDSTSSEPRATDENNTPNKLLGEELASRKRRLSDDFGAKFGLLVGQLNLVDLAGSENARATGAGGGRLKEGGNINKSLLTLSRVISQLAAMRGKAGFINFRDSKLTQILQPSLAGNCRTAIVCCVTPAAKFQEETKSTLSFASRAKQIRTRVSVNEVLDGEGEMRKLKYTIQALRTELASQQDLNAEKTALEEKIQSLKALFLTGGAPLARTSALNDAKASSKLEPSARVPKKRKKQRETWGPGDFATMTFPGSPQEGESMAAIDETQEESEENEDDVTKEFIPEAELPTEVDTEAVITHGNKTSNETQSDDSTGPRAEPIFAAERLIAMQKKVTELKASLEEKAMEAKELEASHAADLAKQEDEHQTAIAKMAESLEVATQNFTEQLKETETLNAKIQELEQDSKEKAETYQSSKDQIRELLEERTLECADLKEQIATMTEDSKTQSEELRVALKNLQQLKDMEQASADSQSESHSGLHDEINALKAAKATADAEKEELENKIKEQEAKFTALETQLASFSKGANSDTHALRTTLEQTEESLRVETQQKVALEAQLAHLQDVLVQAEITRETQLSEIAQEKERADMEASEKGQLKVALESLQIESEQRVVASTALANEELEQVKLEFSSLSAVLESREKAGQDTLEVEVVEAELELALSRVEELEQEIENLEEKLASSQRADELEQKLFETEEKLVSYENDLQLAKEQSEETSSKMLELQEQLEQYTSDSSKAKELLHQALQERDALEQTCETLRSELENTKKALDEACVGDAATHDTDSLESQIELQAAALAEKHKLLTEKEELLSVSKEEAETLQKEVERMQTLLCGQEDASKQIQYLERQLEETTVQAMEAEDLRSKVNQLSRDLHEAEQALDAAVGSNEEQETASCVSMCLQEILLNIERQDFEDQVKIAQARGSTDESRTIYEEISTGEVEDKRLTQVQMQLDLAQQQATQASAVHEEEKAEIQKQTAERDHLISELHAQVEDFQTQLEKAKAEACTSETRASEMEKELGQLKSALEDTEKLSKERLSQAIGDADEEVTEHAQKRISQLELCLNLAEQEKEVAERKLAEVEAARKSLECEAVGDSRELQQRLSEANAQLELAKTEARHASARAEEAREQASDAQRLLEELEQSHKVSMSEVEGLREELAHAKVSLENGSAEATATMDENLRSSIGALERKVASLKETITERDEVIERLNESLDNAKAELEALQEAARTAETNESLEEQVESLSQSKAELEAKIVSMQEELEETTSRLKKVRENTQMIEAERQAQDQRLGELEAQVAAAVDEKSIASLEEKLEAMERLVAELRDNETSAKQGMEQLEAEKLRLVGEMTDLHLRVTQQEAEIRDMKSKEAVVSASAQEKAAAAEAAAKEVEFLNNKLERAKERVMKLEKVKITKEQASKIQQMKEENRSLKYKYAEAKSSKETLVEAQTKIQERYAIAQEQLVTIQDLVGRTARKFGLLDPIQPSDFVKMMTERLVAVQKERDSLEAHCRDMDGTDSPKPEANKADRTEILSLNAEIEGLRDESKKLRLRLKEFEQDYVKSQEEHSKETEMLRRQMEEQKSEIRFLEKENLSLMVANRKVQDESNSRSSGHKEEPVPHSAKKPLAGIENNILASGGSIRKDRSKSSCSETSYVSDVVKRTAAPSSNKENSIDIDTMSTISSSNVNDDNKQECATQ